MLELTGVFSKFGKTWLGYNVDTLVEKLNRNVSVFIFTAFAIVVSTKQYVGKPIHCRHQSIHDENFEKYMNEICWVTNTYYVPRDEVIQNKDVTEYRRINYYQWVPLLLLVQAMMFYIPYVLWQGMLLRSGLDLNSIISTGTLVHTSENREERKKNVRFMACQLVNYLTHYQQIEHGSLAKFSAKIFQVLNYVLCGKRTGNFIALLYVFTKMLYLANAIGQFFILEKFLSSDIHLYGWKVFTSIIAGADWPEGEVFPKSTMCIFKLHVFGGQVHTHVVQCVLPVNFFHDKLYTLVWFWLVFVVIINGLSLIFWIIKFLFRVDRVRFVKHHLHALGKAGSKDKACTKFVCDFLKQDGVFVLRLVNINVSGLVSAQMTGELWEIFKTNKVMYKEDEGLDM